MEFLWFFSLVALCSLGAAVGSALICWRSRPNRLSQAFVDVSDRMSEVEANMAALKGQWTREQVELATLSEAIAVDVDRARKIRQRATAAQSKAERNGGGDVTRTPLDQIEDDDQRFAEATRRARAMGLST